MKSQTFRSAVSVVLYHGARPWPCSSDFIDLFGKARGPFSGYLPSFRHVLVDLGRMKDSELSSDRVLRGRLTPLKYVLRFDLNDQIETVLRALERSIRLAG